MKKNILYLLLFLVAFVVKAQDKYEVNASKLSVTGTSTVHDWECVANESTGAIEAVVTDGVLTKVTDFNFALTVKKLESGKSGMDKKMYDALKEDDNPTITFKIDQVLENASGITAFKGNMNIAGTSKSFTAPVEATVSGDAIQLKGEKTFLLTDFNIEPPTAMFGAINTGDEVTIHYNISLKK
ncbi:YceI family protein [Joostella sp. CR20]|uniref:YceI family protein n=1 Tax=Joostella sp. CR20 TaxID=2804312 RepID=UPI00313DFAE3